MTYRFQDLYAGSGDFSARTPDVGGLYSLSPYTTGGALTDLVLDGSGNLVIARTVAPATPTIPVAKSVITRPSATQWLFRISTKLETSSYSLAEGTGAAPTIYCTIEDTATNAGLFLSIVGNVAIDSALPSTDPGVANWQVFLSTAVGSGYADGTYHSSGDINFDPTLELEFVLRVDTDTNTTTLSINGIDVDSFAMVPDIKPDAVHIGAGSQGDIATGFLRASSIEETATAASVPINFRNHLRPRIFSR